MSQPSIKGPGIARWQQQSGLFVCYVEKVTSSDRSETPLFGNGATKVTFIAALRSRLISAITAMRAIPWRESTRYWMMPFSANMTNDDLRETDGGQARPGNASAVPGF